MSLFNAFIVNLGALLSEHKSTLGGIYNSPTKGKYLSLASAGSSGSLNM